MQEQAEPYTSQGSKGDDHQKFETGSHRTLLGVASFDCSQHEGGERRESIRSPSGLRQGEQHWYCWDEATNHEGDPDLDAFQPRIDARIFDHP